MDGGHYGTYAYVISPTAAAVLLDAVYPCYVQVGWYALQTPVLNTSNYER